MQEDKALKVLLRETLNGHVDWSRHKSSAGEYFTTNVRGRKLSVYPSGVLKLVEPNDTFENETYLSDITRQLYKAADGSGRPDFIENIEEFRGI